MKLLARPTEIPEYDVFVVERRVVGTQESLGADSCSLFICRDENYTSLQPIFNNENTLMNIDHSRKVIRLKVGFLFNF